MLEGLLERVRSLGGALPSRGGRQTPARIMVPRVVFLVTAFGLVLFGLLMIYSSSCIVGLTSAEYDNNPTYFITKQLIFVAAGLVLAVVLAAVDYHTWDGSFLKLAWVVTLLLLAVVYTPVAGRDAYGATRWIALGPFTLQPSEFAKITLLLVGARIAEEYFWKGSLDNGEVVKLSLAGLGVPLALILWQPDKGTTGIILMTVLVMCYLSGVSTRAILIVSAAFVVVALAYSFKDDYSRARILTALNPFEDPYGSGYQLTQGFYAFGSGGLTGLGLGMSREKYNYLPMAHNDFIFAIVGEELGLLGTIGLLAAFGLLLWSGLKIAEQAPDMMGRLIAAGCTSLYIIQLLLNVAGVLGVIPLTGKPVPFVSYGGSSVISCIMLAGLVVSVSLRSELPETTYETRRRELRLADEVVDPIREDVLPRRRVAQPAMAGISLVSDARTSSAGSDRDLRSGDVPVPARSGWRVVDGGASRSSALNLAGGGYRRVDLGPSAADRLRGRRERDG